MSEFSSAKDIEGHYIKTDSGLAKVISIKYAGILTDKDLNIEKQCEVVAKTESDDFKFTALESLLLKVAVSNTENQQP